MAGHWQFTAASTAQPGYNTLVELNLQQSGASVSASGADQIFIAATNPNGRTVIGGNCPGNGSNLLTGSSSGNTVSFTLSEGGNNFSITGSLSNNASTVTVTYQSLSGNCADSGTFSGSLISLVNGTYSGQLNFQDGTTDNVTASVTASTDDKITVSAAVSGMDTGTIALSGAVIGDGFSASGSFQGQQVSYYAYYDASTFAIKVFDAASGTYVGSLYSAGHGAHSSGVGFVQSASFTSQSAASSFSATFNNQVATGDLIALVFWWNNPQEDCAVPVTDSAGNSYRQVLKTSSIDSNAWVACVYVAANVTGVSNLQVSVSPGYSFPYQFSMAALEYSGVSNVDVTATNGGTSGVPVSSGYATTSYPNELLLGVAVADVSTQPGTGFNARFASPYFVVEDKTLTAPGSYQALFSTTNTIQNEGWDAGMVTLH